MARQRITATVRGFAVLAVIGGLSVAVPVAVHAQAEPAPAATVDTATADTSVTLPTGERVIMAAGAGGRQVRSVIPNAAIASDTSRIRTMAVDSHFYVVPDEALTYLGRQLDIGLFDVLAPTPQLHLEWSAVTAPHDIPGLQLEPAVGGRSIGTITDPTAFGAALAQSTEAARAAAARSNASGAQATAMAVADVLAGVASIRPADAAAIAPTANPQYPLATLTVKGLDALGKPAFAGSVSATNAEDSRRYSGMQSLAGGEVSFSVPVGHYSLEVSITTYDAASKYVGDALLVFPEQDIVAPVTSVVADARTAKTVVPVPKTPKAAALEQLQATYSRVSASGFDSSNAYMLVGGTSELSVRPTEDVTIGGLHWYTYFRLNSPATATAPYLYDLVFPAEGGVPAKFAADVPASSLATVDAAYAAEAGQTTINTSRSSFQSWETYPVRFGSTATAPLTRTEYVTALPDVGWMGSAVSRPSEYNGAAQSPMVTYVAGQRYADDYFAAPAVPDVDRGTTRPGPCAVCRQGNTLLLNVQPWTDAGGHAVRMVASATAAVSTKTTITADGTAVTQGTSPVGQIDIPATTARLKLEVDTSVVSAWATTSSKVNTVWSWPTEAPTGTLPTGRTCPAADTPCAFQPLLFASYSVSTANTANAVPAGKAAAITVTVRHQAYDPTAPAGELTLEASGDDGATWTAVPTTAAGDGRFTASVTPAAGTHFLSLRLHAADPAGATLDQRVTRALRVLG